MLNELEDLINFIQTEYIQFTEKWKNSIYYNKINLQSNEIADLAENEWMLNVVFNYREFINENNIKLFLDFKQFNTENAKINIRTKAKNSIEYKIKNYMENHENGKIAINKCLNDLFGIRIICTKRLEKAQIVELVKSKFRKLKCIDSSKQKYKAIHIYFKQDNFNFQWELQIWNKEDEINNINSHEKYKQDYIRWEKENKGGNE